MLVSRPMSHVRQWALAGLVAGAATACGGSPGDSPPPTLALAPCTVAGAERAAQCGILEVYEDRAAQRGRRIALRVVRIPAHGAAAEPDPVFMFAGGPGQAASEAYPPILKVLSRVARNRDVVLVDQRGTGSSAPLDCATPKTLDEHFRDRHFETVAASCAADLEGDPRHYTTANAADDFDDVRAALGYARINIAGGSYGTRMAIEYARRHPERVRAMVLDGVAPYALAIPLPLARDGQRALELVWARCAADPACRAAHPDPAGDFAALRAELGEGKRLEAIHPRTGVPEAFTLSALGLGGAVRGLLYAPELQALLPYTLSRARAGDWGPLVAETLMMNDGIDEQLSMGLFLSVVCAEDVPRIRDADVARETEGTYLGAALIDEFRKACAVWPHAPLPEGLDAPPSHAAPTLLLSGQTDPVTPPRWAELVAQTLPTARHLVVPEMAHGVMIRGCVPHLVADFLEDPAALATLDADCIDTQAPEFFVNFAGPAP